MLLRIIAILFGIGFIFMGVAGFLPTFMINGFLFGIFEVSVVHNFVNLISGILAIMAATTYYYSRLYFQIFGVVFGLLTILGFIFGGDISFLMMHFNMADNFFYLVIALVALYLGFATKKVETTF